MMVTWSTDTAELAKAVAEFEAALPGFWWLVCQDSDGGRAACAVDGNGCQAYLMAGVKGSDGNPLDKGFDCDRSESRVTPSEALRDVMRQALKYLETYRPAANVRGPMTGWGTGTADFGRAIADFEAALPGFWWTVGQCSVGAHASCAANGHLADRGFHCDTKGGSPAEALRDVMQQALKHLDTHRREQSMPTEMQGEIIETIECDEGRLLMTLTQTPNEDPQLVITHDNIDALREIMALIQDTAPDPVPGGSDLVQ